MPKALTVQDALTSAIRYWEAHEDTRSKRGGNMTILRGQRCAGLLGLSRRLSSLGPADGAKLLTSLKQQGLARSTIKTTYGVGKRMLALSGVNVVSWPKAPTPPRKHKEPIHGDDIRRLRDWMLEQGYQDTADLIDLMQATGLRVEVEALNGDFEATGGRLVVRSGKGGHARHIPYQGSATGPLRGSGSGITYEGHLRRWKQGVHVLGLPGDFRPHDLRRHFVKRVYEGSGKDIRVAQVLAGHADPGTTAGYIGVAWDELEAAVA